MNKKEFNAGRFKALEEIAGDPALNGTDKGLAILLLTKHLSCKHKYAWPSRKRLADELGVSLVTVSRAIKVLKNGPHFVVIDGKGRGINNQYYPAFVAEKQLPRAKNQVSTLNTKGINLVPNGYQPCDKSPSIFLKNIPKAREALASPPDGGSRLSLSRTEATPSGREVVGLQEETEPVEVGASLPTPSDGNAHGERTTDTANSPLPNARLRAFEAIMVRSRPPMRDPSWWKERKRAAATEGMSADEAEAYWLEQMAAATPTARTQ